MKNLWIFIVFTISIVKGNILHISTTGNDESGDGSSNNPYLTIQGIDEASSMDTVLVLNGIWQGSVIIDNKRKNYKPGQSMDDTKLNIPNHGTQYIRIK